MSGIVGLSNKEIKALSRAIGALEDLSSLTKVERYSEDAKTIAGILQRVSDRYGGREQTSNSRRLLELLHEMLPPEDDAE